MSDASRRPGAAIAKRDPTWAEPLPEHGVDNLHRITPALYRSAQPRGADVAALQALGIRTIVSLRAFNTDDDALRGSGIRLVRVPINTWHIRERHVVRALAALRSAEGDGPVLLHCLHGADRTGVVSALYRMVEQGWEKDVARREMLHGGFGYHTMWRNIPQFLEEVELERIARAVNSMR